MLAEICQELSRAELRRVRDYEQRNKARKGLLRSLDRSLDRKRQK